MRDDTQLPAAPTASALYEELYARHGYHSDLNYSHGVTLARNILRLRKADVRQRGVLDVGCSHGLAVETLWRGGIIASGIDISPTAVSLAARARENDPARRCGGDAAYGERGVKDTVHRLADRIISRRAACNPASRSSKAA